MFDTTERRVQCPYCFEWMHLELDPDSHGEMVHDCEVCCRPWRVWVQWDPEGPNVVVEREQ